MINQEAKKYFKSVNFFTPEIIEIDFIKEGLAYELSKGNFPIAGSNEKLYGVTIANKNNIINELSKSFTCYKEANDYIEELKDS